MIFAPLAEVPKDLQAVSLLRAKRVGRPEHAHLAHARRSVRLAGAAVVPQIAAQVVQKVGVTHFDSHAAPSIGCVRIATYPPLSDRFENPFGNVEVGVDVLDVVVLVESVHQPQELAGGGFVPYLDGRARQHRQLC
jgi:hypothetical protein